MKNVARTAVVAAVLSLTVACESSTTDTSGSSSPSTGLSSSPTATATPFACPPGPVGLGNSDPFTSPEIKAALLAAPLPPGVMLVNEQDLYNIDDRSMIDVVVRICQPGLAGDPLKDVATTIAYAIRQSPVGEKVKSLRVTNVAEDGNPEGRVSAEDFQIHLWSPDAICCVNRAGWKYASEE